jgi:hypothetical protein
MNTGNRFYFSIDPGAQGAAVIARKGEIRDYLPLSGATARGIWDFISQCDLGDATAVIEKVPTAIFGAGKSSCSKLYGSFCELRAFLVAAQIPFEEVQATKWQKELGIPKRKKNETRTKWKNRLKSHAERLFPQIKVTLAICDALLISEYCRRVHGK